MKSLPRLECICECAPSIGFIGFGEAGFTIARGLRSAGVDRLYAFDIHADATDLGETIRRRARESQTTLVEPIMAEATARRQQWSAVLGLRGRFGAEGPATYREVLDVIDGTSY